MIGSDWQVEKIKSSPQTIIWENIHFSSGYRFKRGVIFLLIISGYLTACIFAILITKF